MHSIGYTRKSRVRVPYKVTASVVMTFRNHSIHCDEINTTIDLYIIHVKYNYMRIFPFTPTTLLVSVGMGVKVGCSAAGLSNVEMTLSQQYHRTSTTVIKGGKGVYIYRSTGVTAPK